MLKYLTHKLKAQSINEENPINVKVSLHVRDTIFRKSIFVTFLRHSTALLAIVCNIYQKLKAKARSNILKNFHIDDPKSLKSSKLNFVDEKM